MSEKKQVAIKPHKKVSREVTDKDIDRVIEDAQEMFKMCVDGCLAVAHCQITEKDPLRFFVTADKIFINVKITRHTKVFVDSVEGCLSFTDKEKITVPRHYRLEFDFQVIDQHKLSEVQHEKVKGISSFVIQHEVDHLDGKYIYKD